MPPLTFTSSDASRLVFSVASGDLGSGSATVRHATTSSYPPSSTVYAPVWLQALDGPADIPVTASIAGYDDVSTVVQVVPTALSFATPYGSPAISTNTQADPVTATINVAPVQQGSTEGMFLRAGLDTFSVPVASSNPAIATAVRNPLVNALTASAQFQVKPLAPGETTLTLSPPPGFVAAPPSLGGSLKVTVDGPSLVISDVTLGRDLQVQLPLSVKTGSSVAPADLDVTLTSSDGSRLLISAAANSPGAASLTLHIGASQSILSQVYLQALDDRGTVTVQISAPGYRTTTATVTLAPTTFAANSSPLNLQLSGGPYSVQVRGVPAPASGTPSYYTGFWTYTFRAGLTPFSIGVRALDSSVAGVTPARLNVSGGTGDMTLSVTANGAGATSLAFDVPAPYLAPPSIPISVQGGQLNWYSVGPVGKDLQLSVGLNGGNNYTGVKVTSSDPARLLVSLTAGAPGQASVTLGQSGTVYLQALGDSGSATLTASGTGYTTASTPVQLVQTAVVLGSNIPQTASTLAGPVVAAGVSDAVAIGEFQLL